MKKMLALLLAAVMVLSMAACAAAPATTPADTPAPAEDTQTNPLKPTKPPRLPQRKRPLPSPKI